MEIADLRFLVVEDHGFQRWALQRMLHDLGAQYVYGAEDGQSALEILRSLDSPVDIVVSDLDMPGMDGMEFIRRVGQERRPLSMMILSSHAPQLLAAVETMAQAYGVHLLATISKPATPAKLSAAIGAHPGGAHRPAPPAPPEEFAAGELLECIEREQLAVYFQPELDIQSRRIIGAEALVRWEHPARGLLMPALLVPAMEASGLITPMTELVLKLACRGFRTWHRAGCAAHVSINVSVTSLADLSLVDRFMRVLEPEGVTPQDIVVEVTESDATSDVGKALENLSRLRMRGFGLAIDDYGTGYSSMQQLARIPFTELKIDQSFVLNASSRPSNRAMLESSLELAAKLGIVAVAEGVETDREWRLVKELGCDVAQGFFLGVPMPLGEFVAHASRQPS